MIIAINIIIFLLMAGGLYHLTEWFWEVGVQEIVVYTERFLLMETRKVRMQKLP